jgi:two-component system, cell cycle response regulator DivK
MAPTILVVEDSTDVRALLVSILTRTGYSVWSAVNGEAALGLLQGQQPDLILLDLSMPILDGWQTLAAIRAMPKGEQQIVAALTAHALPHEREEGLRRGFNTYITKPIDIRAFLQTVSGLLQQGERQRSAE